MALKSGQFFSSPKTMALSLSTKTAQRRQQGIPNGQAELRLRYANDAIRKGSSSLEICLGLLVSEPGPYKAVVFSPQAENKKGAP
jgi:hypothetical protein